MCLEWGDYKRRRLKKQLLCHIYCSFCLTYSTTFITELLLTHSFRCKKLKSPSPASLCLHFLFLSLHQMLTRLQYFAFLQNKGISILYILSHKALKSIMIKCKKVLGQRLFCLSNQVWIQSLYISFKTLLMSVNITFGSIYDLLWWYFSSS